MLDTARADEGAEALCEEQPLFRQGGGARHDDGLAAQAARWESGLARLAAAARGATVARILAMSRAYQPNGAAPDVDTHHVRHEARDRAVDEIEVQLGREVEELDKRETLMRRERLVLRLVLGDARAQVSEGCLALHRTVIGRHRDLLQQIALEHRRVITHGLHEDHLALAV